MTNQHVHILFWRHPWLKFGFGGNLFWDVILKRGGGDAAGTTHCETSACETQTSRTPDWLSASSHDPQLRLRTLHAIISLAHDRITGITVPLLKVCGEHRLRLLRSVGRGSTPWQCTSVGSHTSAPCHLPSHRHSLHVTCETEKKDNDLLDTALFWAQETPVTIIDWWFNNQLIRLNWNTTTPFNPIVH